MAAKKSKKDKDQPKTRDFRNRRAYFDYHILEKFECGIALIGSEVKSLREGSVNFAESYARLSDGELFLVGCHISEYRNARHFGHEATRKRKLLVKRRELRKLEKAVEIKGQTLVPLRIYFNARGFAKVEIGVGKGKKLHDKRQDAKKREGERELRSEISKYQ